MASHLVGLEGFDNEAQTSNKIRVHCVCMAAVWCSKVHLEKIRKSWHPQTLRNVEKVWKAEQKYEAERKKIEELQRELQEERAREEMQRYAEDMGTVR